MVTIPHKVLKNGMKIPQLGLGTYKMEGEECTASVKKALELGIRLIDTAHGYKNEKEVALGIEQSKVPRSEIFLTSKLKPQDHGEVAYERFMETYNILGYIDLFLVHFPGVAGMKPDDTRQPEIRKQTWMSLEKAYHEGKIKALGVSNFEPRHIEELLSYCTVPPVVNQFELHPFLQQHELVECCNKHQIQVEAYASLARGLPELLDHVELLEISRKYGRTVSQTCLRWAIQMGYVVIPKSVHDFRITENLAACEGPDISPEDMEIIKNLDRNHRTCWHARDHV